MENKNTFATLTETSKDMLASRNPIVIIGGIAIGSLAVAGFAIWCITKISGK